MSRFIKNANNQTTSRENYPEQLRDFACTLHFYSAKAYEYVRRTFSLALPHQSVIRKWSANITCYPGFIDICFEVLRNIVLLAKQKENQVICSLLMDEMAIKKQIDFDGKRTWGYVDTGVHIDNYDLDPATEVFVLMVTCHNSHWKLPIAYFFIKSLTASEKANIVKEALIRLHEIDISIISLTCDGPSVHFRMLEILGCEFQDKENLKTWFYHPSDDTKKVFCILDICHMLKLMRNLLATLKIIHTPDGEVKWMYIIKLYDLQEGEALRLANKLKKSHIEWQKQKMKVNLAAQTLSNSVAEALEFLCKEIDHPDFRGAEATILFIKRINNLFDILNSRSPWAKGFKGPLRENNKECWRPFLLDSIKYLLECTDVGGRPLYFTPRKTPILGFIISILSITGIFDSLVINKYLNYLLTYKCSQDHLEIFFSSVRSRNGWNNNPTCLQFMHTFRKLLLFSPTSESGGNCKVLDDTIVLKVPSSLRRKVNDTDEIDVSLCRKYNFDIYNDEHHDYDLIPNFIELNEFSLNVVTYISGFVIKMLKKSVKCPDCISSCIFLDGEEVNLRYYRFLLFKNRGGLTVPSAGVVKICEATEKFIRNVLTLTDNRVPSEEHFFSFFVVLVSQKFYEERMELFPSLVEHNLCFPPNEDDHIVLLIKKIVHCYTRIRFFNVAKRYTEKIQGIHVRKILSKLILFNHQ